VKKILVVVQIVGLYSIVDSAVWLRAHLPSTDRFNSADDHACCVRGGD
jgi:hypothetical protein